MAIKRKLFNEKKIKEPGLYAPEPKKAKRGIDISGLPDAIVDGKLVAPIDSEVLVERVRSKRNITSICVVKKLDDDQTVHLWDETMSQWFLFKTTDKVVVKMKGTKNSS